MYRRMMSGMFLSSHRSEIYPVLIHYKQSLSCILYRKAVQFHVEIGNIYNTIDDNHFRSVTNG
jgi:hypothetical protein